jgi:hypothetical protein
MKKAVLALALALPLAAVAAPVAPGFFTERDQRPAAAFTLAPEAGTTIAGSACGILIQFDSIRPNLGLISFIGTGCIPTQVQAIDAARGLAFGLTKSLAAVGGEPVIPHVYECSTLVSWDVAAADKPTVTATGGDACDATKFVAIYYASFGIECFRLPGRSCTP